MKPAPQPFAEDLQRSRPGGRAGARAIDEATEPLG
jgi:hypothetical protein